MNRTKPKQTERIIQFGTGNFLRAFFDWLIDQLNEHTELDAGIVMLKSTAFPRSSLNEQDGLYTVLSRGLNEDRQVVDHSRLIQAVNRQLDIALDYDTFLALAHDPNFRFIVSNTTEAGIRYEAQNRFADHPPHSFPAKLTRLLYERYTALSDPNGFIIIPCELIDHNGRRLKEIVLQYVALWALGQEFQDWVETHNVFCNTLVDRIVTGYPQQEGAALQKRLGYDDRFLTVAEYFYFFAIEGPAQVANELHLSAMQLNIKLVDDLTPYKVRKVGVLNGLHTLMVPVAYLSGIDTVREAMEDAIVGKFIQAALQDEIIPALNLPAEALTAFAADVLRRFQNPFIEHKLLDIALNSMSKYKTRLLPQLLSYNQTYQQVAPKLSFALAALIYFYRGKRHGVVIPLKDDPDILALYAELWAKYDSKQLTLAQLVELVLNDDSLWQRPLADVAGLVPSVTRWLMMIEAKGMKKAIEAVL